jgi:glycosyltransferase involved in cell wall biosynthesis
MSESETTRNPDTEHSSEKESDRALLNQLRDSLEKQGDELDLYKERLNEAHLAYKRLREKPPVRMMLTLQSLLEGAVLKIRSLKKIMIKDAPSVDLRPLQDSPLPPDIGEELEQFAADDLISIVTPTYNRAYVIEKAIESVMKQTYPHWELIIVDDGSSDDTDAILEKYLDDERVVVVHKKHDGVAASRNAGIRLAHGDYIAFLDSDDIWDKDFLKVMLCHMKNADEKCGILYCDHILYDENSGVLRKQHDPFSYGKIMEEPIIDLCTVLAKKNVLLDAGLFNETMTKWVDHELFLRIADKYDITHVPCFLLHYFRLSDGISETPDHEIGMERNKEIIRRTKEKTLRIGYVLWDYPAVSQSFVLSEIKWLLDRGYDVHVYHTAEPDLKAEPDYDIPTYGIEGVPALVELLKKHKRNILHSHFAYPVTTLLTHPAATEAEIPFTFNPHAVDIFHRDNVERNRIDLVSQSRWCKGVVAVGQYHRDFLIGRGVPAERIFIKPQTSDLRFFFNKERKPPSQIKNVVSISRFVEKKGFEYLVKAALLLTDLPITFNLYGFGPQEAELKTLAGRADNIAFHEPPQSPAEVKEVLAKADLFVLPCIETDMRDRDGIPTSLMEAMASGVPVVSTGISSIPDLVSDRETGFVVPEKDASALAHTIRRICAMPTDELQKIIHAAHIRIEDDFDPERLNRRLVRAWLR